MNNLIWSEILLIADNRNSLMIVFIFNKQINLFII